jgi:hypothetical protein
MPHPQSGASPHPSQPNAHDPEDITDLFFSDDEETILRQTLDASTLDLLAKSYWAKYKQDLKEGRRAFIYGLLLSFLLTFYLCFFYSGDILNWMYGSTLENADPLLAPLVQQHWLGGPGNYLSAALLLLVNFLFIYALGRVEEPNLSVNYNLKMFGPVILSSAFGLAVSQKIIEDNLTPFSLAIAKGSLLYFFSNLFLVSGLSIGSLIWRYLKDLRKTQNPGRYIVFNHLNILSRLGLEADPIAKSDWTQISHRADISAQLEDTADLFEAKFLQEFREPNPYRQKLYSQELRKIANGYRDLKLWLLTPMADTRQQLRKVIFSNLMYYVQGNLHEMYKTETALEATIPRKEKILTQIRGYAAKLFRAFLPLILLWLFQQTPLRIEGDLFEFVAVGILVLTAIMLMLEIDPRFSEKIDLLKELKSLVNLGDSNKN